MNNLKRLKNIKLIVSDMDGTLLNSSNEIGKESSKLISSLVSQGVRFTFATGRLHSAAIDHARSLGIKTPLITLDGSLIKGIDNQIIYESYVPRKYVKKAIKLSDFYLLNIALCHDEAIYYNEQSPFIPELLDKFGAKYQPVESLEEYIDKTLEVVLIGDHKASMQIAEKKMTFPYAFGLNSTFYKSRRRRDSYFLEARKHGASKGKALSRLLKKLKIDISEVAVIGDWHNDITLFETNAFKVAVANAVDLLKSKADLVLSKSNEEDGVAEFLDLVIKSRN